MKELKELVSGNVKFKVGDRVRRIWKASHYFGMVGTVVESHRDGQEITVVFDEDEAKEPHDFWSLTDERFELIQEEGIVDWNELELM